MKHKGRFIGIILEPGAPDAPCGAGQNGRDPPGRRKAVRKRAGAGGKKAGHVRKDVPSFIANRLQHALWREAISLVEHGIADAQTVDMALKYGPACGCMLAPLENADMVGLDLTLNIHSYVLRYLRIRTSRPRCSSGLQRRAKTGFKAGGHGFYDLSPEEMQQKRKS